MFLIRRLSNSADWRSSRKQSIMRLQKVCHRFSVFSPPPRSPTFASFLSLNLNRSTPIYTLRHLKTHSKATPKSINTTMNSSRFLNLVPISAIVSEDGGGSGSNGSLSAAASSAAAEDEGGLNFPMLLRLLLLC